MTTSTPTQQQGANQPTQSGNGNGSGSASGGGSGGSATGSAAPRRARGVKTLKSVAIRFCGDSGDGMQLAGTQFTDTSALVGNDISTLPDFPAEIRAPAGTLPGVSG